MKQMLSKIRNRHIRFSKYMVPMIIVAIFTILFWHGFRLVGNYSIQAKTPVDYEISFESVFITSQDTLWSIATEYYSKDYGYDSIQEYIDEIKQCNSLESESIYAGSSLLVPIYVPVETKHYS